MKGSVALLLFGVLAAVWAGEAATELELGEVGQGELKPGETAKFTVLVEEPSVTLSALATATALSAGSVVPNVFMRYGGDPSAGEFDAQLAWPHGSVIVPAFGGQAAVSLNIEVSNSFLEAFNFTIYVNPVQELISDKTEGNVEKSWTSKPRVVSGEELVFRVTVPDGIQRVHVLVDVCGSDILPFGVHPYVGLNTSLWHQAPRMSGGLCAGKTFGGGFPTYEWGWTPPLTGLMDVCSPVQGVHLADAPESMYLTIGVPPEKAGFLSLGLDGTLQTRAVRFNITVWADTSPIISIPLESTGNPQHSPLPAFAAPLYLESTEAGDLKIAFKQAMVAYQPSSEITYTFFSTAVVPHNGSSYHDWSGPGMIAFNHSLAFACYLSKPNNTLTVVNELKLPKADKNGFLNITLKGFYDKDLAAISPEHRPMPLFANVVAAHASGTRAYSVGMVPPVTKATFEAVSEQSSGGGGGGVPGWAVALIVLAVVAIMGAGMFAVYMLVLRKKPAEYEAL